MKASGLLSRKVSMSHNSLDKNKAVHYVARCVQLDQEISSPKLESHRNILEALQKELAAQKPT